MAEYADELPSVAERLLTLRPSQELLEFYRQKIAEFDNEHGELLEKLDRCKTSHEDIHKQEWTMAQREEEINELQSALSDLQVYLFQERENVLRLYAENDRLKIRQLEDHTKIQHLLGLSTPLGPESTYFKDPAGHPLFVLQDRPLRKPKKSEREKALDAVAAQAEHESLSLALHALQAQMDDQTRLNTEQVAALLDDRRVREEEFSARLVQEAGKNQTLVERLQHAQTLLCDSTRDYLELKFRQRHHEKGWAEEKERLLQRIEELKDDVDRYHRETKAALALAHKPRPSLAARRLTRDIGSNAYLPGGRGAGVHSGDNGHDDSDGSDGSDGSEGQAQNDDGAEYYARGGAAGDAGVSLNGGVGTTRRAASEAAAAARETSLAEMYRVQCLQLEDDLSRLREDRSAHAEQLGQKSSRMAQRLKLATDRYEQLERRRKLEAEGYQAAIKLLKERLRSVEKQLYRFTLRAAGPASALDDETMRSVLSQAARDSLQQLARSRP